MMVIGRMEVKSTLECWRKTYQIYNTEELLTGRHGKPKVGGRHSLEQRLAQATQEHKTLRNHLNRQFKQNEPEKFFVTDIAYLPT
ncbi:hypothetical protein [Exiguobacterium sp. CH10]|uniref:hypothetical protein n=1 Tax=Exiguobacterium sp. CH10 TaxID=2751261 RepID=UPI001BEC3A11|nr:hypothetical protein [Exiguobacterium sp. CH10]